MYYCLLLALWMYILRDISIFAEFRGWEMTSCLASIGSLLCWLGSFMCLVHILMRWGMSLS